MAIRRLRVLHRIAWREKVSSGVQGRSKIVSNQRLGGRKGFGKAPALSPSTSTPHWQTRTEPDILAVQPRPLSTSRPDTEGSPRVSDPISTPLRPKTWKQRLRRQHRPALWRQAHTPPARDRRQPTPPRDRPERGPSGAAPACSASWLSHRPLGHGVAPHGADRAVGCCRGAGHAARSHHPECGAVGVGRLLKLRRVQRRHGIVGIDEHQRIGVADAASRRVGRGRVAEIPRVGCRSGSPGLVAMRCHTGVRGGQEKGPPAARCPGCAAGRRIRSSRFARTAQSCFTL